MSKSQPFVIPARSTHSNKVALAHEREDELKAGTYYSPGNAVRIDLSYHRHSTLNYQTCTVQVQLFERLLVSGRTVDIHDAVRAAMLMANYRPEQRSYGQLEVVVMSGPFYLPASDIASESPAPSLIDAVKSMHKYDGPSRFAQEIIDFLSETFARPKGEFQMPSYMPRQDNDRLAGTRQFRRW